MAGEMAVVVTQFDGHAVQRRLSDNYYDATALCAADGKKWADYYRLKTTKAFLRDLSSDMGIPISDLVQVQKGGRGGDQGTWIHPRVVMNLGQWCSSRFAVWVTKQIETLLTAGRVELQPSESSALTLSGDNRPVTHAELQQMLAPILRGEPWTTVPARCKFWGWYPVPDKEMDEIRSMAYEKCLQVTGEKPVMLLRHRIWCGEQIPILDEMISRVREKFNQKTARMLDRSPSLFKDDEAAA